MPVYFVRVVGENMFKIGGCFTNPVQRMQQIQPQSPNDLELYAVVRTKDPWRRAELAAHRMVEDYHVRGEWYAITPQQVDQIIAHLEKSPTLPLLDHKLKPIMVSRKVRKAINALMRKHDTTESNIIAMCIADSLGISYDNFDLVFKKKDKIPSLGTIIKEGKDE